MLLAAKDVETDDAACSRPPTACMLSTTIVFCWLAMLSTIELSTSTVTLDAVVPLALVATCAVAGAGALRAKVGLPLEAALPALCVLAGVAGIVRICAGSIPVVLGCLGVQAFAAGLLLLALQERAHRIPTRQAYLGCAIALAGAGGAYVLLSTLGQATGIAANVYALARLALWVLAAGMLAAGVLEAVVVRPWRFAKRFAERADDEIALPVKVVFCLTCALALFMGGFSLQPHYFSWNGVACATGACTAIVGVLALACLKRQTRIAPPHANAIMAFALVGTIAGTALLVSNQPVWHFASNALLDSVRLCCLALVILMAAHTNPTRFTAGPLVIIATGLPWAQSAGIAAKQLVGFDFQIMAPIAAAAVALIAVTFFCVFVISKPSAAFAPKPEPGQEPTPRPLAGVAFPGIDSDPLGNASAPLGSDSTLLGNTSAPSDGAPKAPEVVSWEIARQKTEPQATPQDALQESKPRAVSQEVPEVPPQKTPLREVPLTQSAQQAEQIIVEKREELLGSYGLSPRELQISLMVIDGMTAQAIANELNIAVSTVKFHLGNCYRKTGVQSKYELAQLTKRAISEEGCNDQQ